MQVSSEPMPTVPVGQIRSFGELGPKYQVGSAPHQSDSGEWMIEVTLVETGEKTEYRISRLLSDPVVH